MVIPAAFFGDPGERGSIPARGIDSEGRLPQSAFQGGGRVGGDGLGVLPAEDDSGPVVEVSTFGPETRAGHVPGQSIPLLGVQVLRTLPQRAARGVGVSIGDRTAQHVDEPIVGDHLVTIGVHDHGRPLVLHPREVFDDESPDHEEVWKGDQKHEGDEDQMMSFSVVRPRPSE